MVAITSTGPSTLGRMCWNMILTGPMPIRRAASTYSLLRSTSVTPRTVRAYCTQNDRPMASTRIQNLPPSIVWFLKIASATPSISSAVRMAGNVSCTSAMRMITAVGAAAGVAGPQPERQPQGAGEQHRA